MPQTRYVLSKALARGLSPVVVLNKCDREGARTGGPVENEIFDLLCVCVLAASCLSRARGA